jgi:hypothetical protein
MRRPTIVIDLFNSRPIHLVTWRLMVAPHHFSDAQLARDQNAGKMLVFSPNLQFVRCRKNGHLMLKNVTKKKRSATKTRQRDTANRRIVWWSKSREEPLTRTSSVASYNQG